MLSLLTQRVVTIRWRNAHRHAIVTQTAARNICGALNPYLARSGAASLSMRRSCSGSAPAAPSRGLFGVFDGVIAVDDRSEFGSDVDGIVVWPGSEAPDGSPAYL